DNTGGGAGADTTEILRELLRVGARQTTVACLWDAEAVQACVKAGGGAPVTGRVGGNVGASAGGAPGRRERPDAGEDPGREIVGPLPRRLRAARPHHRRGGRARPLVLELRALHVQARAPADL